jgi:hypothetical protein
LIYSILTGGNIMEGNDLQEDRKMIFAPGYTGSDRRNGKDRRTEQERRKYSNPNYPGPERRSGIDRRSGKDRRKTRRTGHLQ